MNKRALMPGSYDPPTKGHEDLWKRLASLFDLVIAIGSNPAKPNTLLLAETRAELIRRVLADSGLQAEVIIYTDLIDHCLKRAQADLIVRGMRGVEDLSLEMSVQDYIDRCGGPPTLYVPAPAHLRTCSSSFVRGLLPFEGADADLERLLPRSIFRCLRDRALDLRREFESLWKDLGAAGEARPVFEYLLLRYSEHPREYHTLSHIRWNLRRLDEMRASGEYGSGIDWNAVRWATWFHDAVRHGLMDDEIRSASLACKEARNAGLPVSFQETVERLVFATSHQAPSTGADERAIVDADLSILSATSEEFDRYDGYIRVEYAHVPDQIFYQHRAKILERFLDHPGARENIERTLARYRAVSL